MRRWTLVGLGVLVLVVILMLLAHSPRSREAESLRPPAPPAVSPPVPVVPPPLPTPPVDAAEPAPAPPPAAVATCYRVLDPDGRPVKGARLWADSEGGASEAILGETGAEGTLPIAPAKGPRLVVRAAGFVAYRGDPAALPVEDGARVVRLARGAVLRGHLTDRDGRPLSIAGTVAVWSEADQRTVSIRQYLHPEVDGALVATVDTDATGQFTIEGADPDLAYHLVGGAKGYIFAGPWAGAVVRTTDPETPLPLEPLYGMVARLHDSDGGPMEINWENPAGASFSIVFVDREGYSLVSPGTVAGRLCFRDLPTPGPAANGDYLMVWLLRQVPGPHGPLRFHFRVQGYELSTFEKVPTPVAEGLCETLVTMARTTPRTVKGSVRFRFDLSLLGADVRRVLGDRNAFMPKAATLHFFPEPPGGGGSQRTKPIPFPLPAEFVVDEVEAGTYRVRMYSPGPNVPLAMVPDRVAVEGGKESSCTLTIKAAQCLALDVTEADGRPFQGAFRIDMTSGPVIQTEHGPGRNATVGFFAEKPYILLFVDEGPVELRVLVNGFKEAVATPTVVPGTVTRCAIRLEKK